MFAKKTLVLTALLATLLPAGAALADRGDRYRDWHHGGSDRYDRSRSSFSFNIGFGSGGYYGSDYSYVNVGYGRGYRGYSDYCATDYYRPAPVIVAPRPVYYYTPAPAPVYYYTPAPTYYYTPAPVYYYPGCR